MLTIAARPMEPAPRNATMRRLNLEPNSASTAALANGSATTSQRKCSMSASQLAGGVNVQLRLLSVEEQDERQSDGDFSRSHGEDEEEHDLPVGLSPARAGCDEREAAGVEHDLKAHEREDEITPRDQSCQPQREQDRRQYHGVLYWYLRHVLSPPLRVPGGPGGRRLPGPPSTAGMRVPPQSSKFRIARCQPVWGRLWQRVMRCSM